MSKRATTPPALVLSTMLNDLQDAGEKLLAVMDGYERLVKNEPESIDLENATEAQRQLVLLARDASQLACKLYPLIRSIQRANDTKTIMAKLKESK